MIELAHLSKTFGSCKALDDISCEFKRGRIYGLTGSNGSGKTTLLRMIGEIIQPDHGSVRNTVPEESIIYAMENPYFLKGASLQRMSEMYRTFHPEFDCEYFREMVKYFGLDDKRSLQACSKGIKRQASAILALSCCPSYLLLDETFDGLDPVMRKRMRQVIVDEVTMNRTGIVIVSHSLRELEEICDHVLLLHQGKLLMEGALDALKGNLMKVQVAYAEPFRAESFPELNIRSFKRTGSIANMIVEGDRRRILTVLRQKKPLILEVVPLPLEEIFLQELESVGYSQEDLGVTDEGESL